ncbi:LON peptidase substrate-binding domain-containing protein [Diaphorobacter ruginosibacter]|uniref:LON peptidase substrate-binding domain-containing protein n=1 Tax=Diaphorobacter ruginosibacter TaxID=1715720 RepID=A0A7G9RL26_9BURK|nr:LON peptidase substrate-binding domain-containing protein [Diaphorobacter ruginosibacter]QNN56301.1 LON peptidase substrate-binding domain-containing protein [Diaphorobacter ruginosibacter]
MSQQLTLSSLPLFPLNTVLFPGGELALRVFEVRYLDMVRKCHHAGAPFGVVALSSGSEVRKAGAPEEQLYATGTLATIEELQSPQAGLLAVRCKGGDRFQIVEQRLLGHGLWVADVRIIPADQSVAIPQELQYCADLLATALHSLRERAPETVGITPDAEQLNDCAWVSNRWCELLPLPLELKQRLMSLDNPLARLELVSDVLEKTGISR